MYQPGIGYLSPIEPEHTKVGQWLQVDQSSIRDLRIPENQPLKVAESFKVD